MAFNATKNQENNMRKSLFRAFERYPDYLWKGKHTYIKKHLKTIFLHIHAIVCSYGSSSQEVWNCKRTYLQKEELTHNKVVTFSEEDKTKRANFVLHKEIREKVWININKHFHIFICAVYLTYHIYYGVRYSPSGLFFFSTAAEVSVFAPKKRFNINKLSIFHLNRA